MPVSWMAGRTRTHTWQQTACSGRIGWTTAISMSALPMSVCGFDGSSCAGSPFENAVLMCNKYEQTMILSGVDLLQWGWSTCGSATLSPSNMPAAQVSNVGASNFAAMFTGHVYKTSWPLDASHTGLSLAMLVSIDRDQETSDGPLLSVNLPSFIMMQIVVFNDALLCMARGSTSQVCQPHAFGFHASSLQGSRVHIQCWQAVCVRGWVFEWLVCHLYHGSSNYRLRQL